MDSYAMPTTGESLWIEDDEGVLKEIEEIKSSPQLQPTPQRLDCTHMKCSSMTYKNGIPDLGSDLAWTCNLMPLGAPNSNFSILKDLNRDKVRRIVVKLPAHGAKVVFQGQVVCGIAQRSVNAIADLNVSVTPCSSLSIMALDETYKVTYDVGEGTGTVSDATAYEPGESVTVKPATGVEYAGHTFSGWCTDESGVGTIYQAGESFVIYEDTTLHAIWMDGGAAAMLMSEPPAEGEQEAS